MTKLFKSLALVAVLAVSATSASADQYTFSEGTWAVAARAGIAPATFSRDAELTTSWTDLSVAAPVPSLASVKKSFNQLYSIPFTVAVDVEYAPFCDNWTVFGSFEYDHACGDDVSYTHNFLGQGVATKWDVRDFNGYAGYLGSRWYFCGFDCIVPFVGAKLGIKGHSQCNSAETLTVAGSLGTFPFARSSKKDCAAFAGGLQLGFDWYFDDCYALTFMSEMVGVAARRFDGSVQQHNDPAFVANQFALTSQVTKNPRGYLSFPLTLGVRVRL